MGAATPRPGGRSSSPPESMVLPVPCAEDGQVTVGVIVEVPEPWASQLQTWRIRFGDHRADSIPTHITLVPPTAVPVQELDDVRAHLLEVAAGSRAFQVALEGTDTFRPVSPVAFVRVVTGADDCDRLQKRIRGGPLQRELAFPYHPHVTVAHALADDALDHAQLTLQPFRAHFTVGAFGLFEHSGDEVWRLRERFPFVG